MAYVKIQNTYWNQLPTGQLQAVSDPATLRGLMSGAIPATEQNAIAGGADRFASTVPPVVGSSGVPIANPAPVTPVMPTQTQTPTNPLLRFADMLNQVTELARTKRERIAQETLGNAGFQPGQVAPGTFASILQNLEQSRRNFVQPLTTTVEKAYTDTQNANAEDQKLLSVAEAKSLGLPYGTTVGEARQRGIVPGVDTTTGGGTGSTGGSATSRTGSTTSKNTLTLAEAKSLGLPNILVGKSEAQVLSDLQLPHPAAWFVEMIKQTGELPTLLPTDVIARWNTFRNTILGITNKTSTPKTSSTSSTSGLPSFESF